MRGLVRLAWLAAALTACATAGVGSDDTTATPTPKKDAGTADASPFGKDASTPEQDAAPPPTQQDSGAPQQDSGNNNNTSCTAYQGALATWDLSSEPGNETSAPASGVATGLGASDLSRASALTAVSGSSSINSSNWTTSSSIDTTRYYAFTLTPPSGCTLDVTKLSITTSASSTGPKSAALATSDDNFAQTTSVTIGTATPSVSVSGASGAVEVRVYGYGASSTSGTMRISSKLTVSGSIQ